MKTAHRWKGLFAASCALRNRCSHGAKRHHDLAGRLFINEFKSLDISRYRIVPVSRITTFRLFAADAGSNASTADNGGFVESWIAIKDNLLSIEIGLLESRHWMEAQELINALRTNPKLGDVAVPNRIQYMFDVMDRLAAEMGEYNNREKHDSRTLHQLDSGVLNKVLLAWLKCISTMTGVKSMSRLLFEKKQRSARGSGKLDAKHVLGELCTDSILKKVKRYITVGLFHPCTTPFSIILHGMNKADDPQSSPYRAHEIYLELLKQSNNDPFDTTYHPDQRIVYDMIEIWASSWLPESYKQIDEYFMSLKEWHNKTNRKDLQPQPNMFCAVMEGHSRSNEQRAALARIKDLLDEMEATFSPELMDTRVYTRICHALSGCSLPEAADTARSILDNLCQSALDSNSKLPKPDRHIFGTVITAYSQLGRIKDVKNIFGQMDCLAKHTNDDTIQPNAVIYSALIWAFAKVGDTKQAEAVMHRLLENIEDGAIGSVDESIAWEGVLVSWAESRDPYAGEYIVRLIQGLLNKSQEKKLDNVIGTSMLNILLRNYSLQATKEGALMAEQFFRWMECQYNEHMKPDSYSYLNLITAWCNVNNAESGEKVLLEFCNKIVVANSVNLRLANSTSTLCLTHGRIPNTLKRRKKPPVFLTSWNHLI